MGYRSEGMIWLPDETYKHLTEELLEDLHSNWKTHESVDDVWCFDYWKWYEGYEDVDRWKLFIHETCVENDLESDLIVIGEDGAEVDRGSGNKFTYRPTIEVY